MKKFVSGIICGYFLAEIGIPVMQGINSGIKKLIKQYVDSALKPLESDKNNRKTQYRSYPGNSRHTTPSPYIESAYLEPGAIETTTVDLWAKSHPKEFQEIVNGIIKGERDASTLPGT